MKPPVSASSCANGGAPDECKAAANQCSFAGVPDSICAAPAVGGGTCKILLNGQANATHIGGTVQVDATEPRQNGPVNTSSQNGIEKLGLNETQVNDRLTQRDDAAAPNTGEAHQEDEVDLESENATGELSSDEDEDLDEQLEAAYCAGTTVDSKDDDNAPAEDWETEIVPPAFIVPEKAYLYGKDVFLPSELHAPTTRRRCPQFHVVEGQFDDADT